MLENSFYYYIIAFIFFGSLLSICRRRQQQAEQQQAVTPISGEQIMTQFPQGGVPNAYSAPPATGYATTQQYAPVQQVPYSGSVPIGYASPHQNVIQPAYAVAVPIPNSSIASASTPHVQAAYIR